MFCFFFFQAEDGIRDLVRSRGLGDVYKRQPVLPGDSDDDNIFGLGPNANEDEDDHDPAAPVIVDIALNKTVTTVGPYSYGQTVSYDILLTNQGNIPLTNIVAVSYTHLTLPTSDLV